MHYLDYTVLIYFFVILNNIILFPISKLMHECTYHNITYFFFQVIKDILSLVYDIKPELHANYRI